MKAKAIIKRVGVLALSAWALTSGGSWADGGAKDFGDGARWASQEPVRPYGGYRDGQRSTAKGLIDMRQARQEARIHQGLGSGGLTRAEARALMQQQRHIRRLERDFRSDGFLSRAEFRILDRRLDAASRHIYREKHDDQWRHARFGQRPLGLREGERSRW